MKENGMSRKLAGGTRLARRYAAFCLFEEVVFACLLCHMYATHPDRASPQTVQAAVLALFACTTATNAALYCWNRDSRWQELGLWHKGLRVLVAIMTASVVFCVGFALLGLAVGMEMGPIPLLTLSGMAGVDFGVIGLLGFYLAAGNGSDENEAASHELAGHEMRTPRWRERCLHMKDGYLPDASGVQDELGSALPGSQGLLEHAEGSEPGGYVDGSLEKEIAVLRRHVGTIRRNSRMASQQSILSSVIEVDRLAMGLIADDSGYLVRWEESSGSLRKLLSEAEELLIESSAAVFSQLPEHKSVLSDDDAVALGQRLNAYLCIAAGFAKDNRVFDERLSAALHAAEANVDHLLSHWYDDSFVSKERVGRYGFYEPGTRYWTEPLALVAYAASRIRKSREVRHAYERFIDHLENAGADLEGVRARLLLDAELTLGNLLGDSIEEIYPEYPLDFSATESIRNLVADNPSLPIVVFAGPEGTCGTYCDIAKVEVVELLNRKTCYYDIANVATSRDELVSAIEQDIRDLGCTEDYDASWTDAQVTQAAEREAASFDDDWVPAIAIYVNWKEA